ncbi:hypothetical protein ACSQ67_000057 [Phaseolus vulgaris]
MALSKLILASLLASLLLLHLVNAHQSFIISSKSLRKSLWKLVVNAATASHPYFGHQGMCSCYARLTTHDGKRKCP